MPTRDFRMGVAEIVWGISTNATNVSCTLDFGDGNTQNCLNADRSYIAFSHTYGASGQYTVTLTVNGESATELVNVYNAAALSADELRALNINRAIQDGLRYLWLTQSNRTSFDTTLLTNWSGGGTPVSETALVVLAFQNHGYLLPNNNNPPTGIYQKYVVQRGLNYVADRMFRQTLGAQPAGNPCVGNLVDPCNGLFTNENPGYSSAVAALPFAASNAPSRQLPAGIGGNNAGFVAGQTLGQITQRLINTIAWGQNDSGCSGRGGWIYGFSNNTCQQSDGSTVGWDILALLDAGAAGVVVPAFVKSEFETFALPAGLNNNGTFDYRADGNLNALNNVNQAKTGIGLQGLFYAGRPLADAQTQAAINYLVANWNSGAPAFSCFNGTANKGCGYAMFNIFKALKLYGVTSLPGLPDPDWYRDYTNFLVSTQVSPTASNGGHWSNLAFSCCFGSVPASTALAELILAPVALVLPDPEFFGTLGLVHKDNNSTAPFTNPARTSHTVTAVAKGFPTVPGDDSSRPPVPGAQVNFQVISGPNSGKSGSGITDANGLADFTYTDDQTTRRCDADADGDIDNDDLTIIRNANGLAPQTTLVSDELQASIGTLKSNILIKNWAVPDPRDGNGDGAINALDVRYCSARRTQ